MKTCGCKTSKIEYWPGFLTGKGRGGGGGGGGADGDTDELYLSAYPSPQPSTKRNRSSSGSLLSLLEETIEDGSRRHDDDEVEDINEVGPS